jgi:hypothetical protein
MLFLAIFLALLVESSYAVTCYSCTQDNEDPGINWGGPCYEPTSDGVATDRLTCEYCAVQIVRRMDLTGKVKGNILLELV